MLQMQTPPQAGVEGFLMDLEFAHLKCSSLGTTNKINVTPVAKPDGMTAPTVRSHTIFGLEVMDGGAMTVRFSFRCDLYPLITS